MLSQTTVNKINDQIRRELHTVNSSFSSHEDKMEALERIAKLKELLNPQPSRQDILRELAIALTDRQTPTPHSASDLVTEIFATFRR
jgi:hypothetical protein